MYFWPLSRVLRVLLAPQWESLCTGSLFPRKIHKWPISLVLDFGVLRMHFSSYNPQVKRIAEPGLIKELENSAGIPAVLVPVPAFFYRPLPAEEVVFLPDHQVGNTRRNVPGAFGALVGFDCVDRRHVLNEPVAVCGVLHLGRGVENARDVSATGGGFLPLAGGGAGV